ncbi:hypothetical protein SCLCIDRAFT_69324, partial [Scleroderma citrinum Foug A]
KKWNTSDLLTIFLDTVTVKFTKMDGSSETLQGRWCMVCRDNAAYVAKYGKWKTFHLGSNSACQQHIHLHYKLYQQQCTEQNIAENNHAIPWEVLEERRQQQVR